MVKTVTITSGLRFGLGADILLEEPRGEAVAYDSITDGGAAQTTTSNLTLIRSQEQLTEAMGVSVSASVRYGLSSVDARMSFARDHSVNDTSTYLMLRATTLNPARSLVGARLRDEAAALFKRDPEQFRRAYGDSYVDSIYSGGDLSILYIFRSHDTTSHEKLTAGLDIAINGLFAGGSLSASCSTEIATVASDSSMEIWAFISGTKGAVNPRSMDEALGLYHDFNANVAAAGDPHLAVLKPFEQLPLPPGPTFAESLARQDTVTSCGAFILEAISARGKIDFILSHPNQFVLPDLPALHTAREQYNALIPAWAQRAQACAVDIGQCSIAGLDKPNPVWPDRVLTLDPLGAKLDDVSTHDSWARPAFVPENMSGEGRIDRVYDTDPRDPDSRWRIFYQGGDLTRPIAGIFYKPACGAHIVYGSIFTEYWQRGHCQGALGYPTTDEMFALPSSQLSGRDRFNAFEYGLLWWSAKTNEVFDHAALPDELRAEAGRTAADTNSELLSKLAIPVDRRRSDLHASIRPQRQEI